VVNLNDIQQKVYGAYDALYMARQDNILWGDKPGRLLYSIKKYCLSGKILDAGCGDEKNALFLERNGFQVVGFDYSEYAIAGLFNRFEQAHWKPQGKYFVQNVQDSVPFRPYDVIVSYGLFHCLPVQSRQYIHQKLLKHLRLNGIVLFSCLTDALPLPPDHATDTITLVQQQELSTLFEGWEILYYESGTIGEEHLPMIGDHKHSAVWIVVKKVVQDG